MAKILKIDNCLECPNIKFYEYSVSCDKYPIILHNKTSTKSRDFNFYAKIHPDCKLENYENIPEKD